VRNRDLLCNYRKWVDKANLSYARQWKTSNRNNWLLVSALILYRAVEQPEAQNNVGHGMLKMRQYVSVCEDEGIKRSSTIATLSRAPTMLRKALT
jgi:hypothetical protein